MQASRWVHISVFLDGSELRELFSVLQPILFYSLGKIVAKGQEMTISAFLSQYERYVEAVSRGENAAPFQGAYVLTTSEDDLIRKPVRDNQWINQMRRPAVQITPHALFISSVEDKIYSARPGPETAPWGLQFSYPQLYQDPDTGAPTTVKPALPNTQLFHAIRRFVRHHSAPITYRGKNYLMRISANIKNQRAIEGF